MTVPDLPAGGKWPVCRHPTTEATVIEEGLATYARCSNCAHWYEWARRNASTTHFWRPLLGGRDRHIAKRLEAEYRESPGGVGP